MKTTIHCAVWMARSPCPHLPAHDARFILIGAKELGGITLNRFYILHCIFIPLVAGFLMAVHFWRIRKDGGISGPQ